MTQLYRLLHAQLSQLGIPVYAQDAVPCDASFPYLAFSADLPGDMSGSGTLTLTAWYRGDTPHSERLRMAELLVQFIPLSGLPLWMAHGLAVCWRRESSAVRWLKSHDAKGVEVQHDLYLYPNAT